MQEVDKHTENHTESMPEDDPNGNVNSEMGQGISRWGPKHAGAKTLASMYSTSKFSVLQKLSIRIFSDKRVQEVVSISIALTLFATVFALLIYNLTNISILSLIANAIFGIVVADFLSGLVHWGADVGHLDFGSVKLPLNRNSQKLNKNF